MDSFAQNGAGASARHASPDLVEPPRVHDPSRPGGFLGRRRNSPQPFVQRSSEADWSLASPQPLRKKSALESAQTAGTNSATDQTEAEADLSPSLGTPSPLSPPFRPSIWRGPESRVEARKTTPQAFLEDLKEQAPGLVSLFEIQQKEQDELAEGWHEQFVMMKEKYDTLAKGLYVPQSSASKGAAYSKKNVTGNGPKSTERESNDDLALLKNEAFDTLKGYVNRNTPSEVPSFPSQFRDMEDLTADGVFNRSGRDKLATLPEARAGESVSNPGGSLNTFGSDVDRSPPSGVPSFSSRFRGMEDLMADDFFDDDSDSVKISPEVRAEESVSNRGRGVGTAETEESISNSSSIRISPKFHSIKGTPRNTAPASPATYDIQLLKLQVQIRLLPVTILLSQKPLTSAAITQAKIAARGAYHLVRSSPGSSTRAGKALFGRCCFYMGVCRLALRGPQDYSAYQWLTTALDAKGTYAEGEWAARWLRKLQRLQASEAGTSMSMSPTAAVSPKSAGSGSLVNGLWNMVASRVRPAAVAAQAGPTDMNRLPERRDGLGIALDEARRDTVSAAGEPGRVPTFDTWHTGESGDQQDSAPSHPESSRHPLHYSAGYHHDHRWGPSVLPPGEQMEFVQSPDRISHTTTTDTDEEQNIPNNVHGGLVPISELKSPLPPNPSDEDGALQTTQRSFSDASAPLLPPSHEVAEGELPSPVTSPTNDHTGRSPKRSKSVAFSALERLSLSGVGAEGSASSPTSSISNLNRRRLSTAVESFAIMTGMRDADELGLAEEGHSPFASTFAAAGEKKKVKEGKSVRSPRKEELASLV